MATKIGFQLTNQPTTFDASAGLKDVLDTLNTQEKDRETQRQKWRDEQDEFFKSANDLKATPNQQANEFFGKWSGGLMSEATELQSGLENGKINSRDYAAQFRNLTQSNEQMIGAQKNYQTNAQRVADGVADGSLSSINSTDFNEYNKALELGAIEVERDGRGGFKVFNKNTGKVYNPYQLNNLTIGNIPRFDYNKAAATAVTQFGKRGIKDAAGNTVKGVYANMPGAELDILMEREAKVFVGSNQARTASILVDGLGYDVVYDKKDLKENTILKNQDGTFTFTEADEAAAVNEMKTALKNALPKDIEERQTLSEEGKERKRANIARETAQKLRDAKANAKAGDVIFADPNEAFEAYIVADEDLMGKGVNADLLSDKDNPNLNDTINNQENASEYVIAPLVAKFGDLGFSFTLDNVSDFFTVVGPSGGEGIRIDYDEQPEDALEEYQRLMSFIRNEFVDPDVLQSKYSVIGYDRFGPGAVYVDASGKPISGGVGGKYNPKE